MLSAIFRQSVFLIQLIQHVLDRHIFHMFRHLNRHAEPVIHFRYKVYDQEGIKPEITDQKCVFFDRCVDVRFQDLSENFQFFLFCQIIFLRIHLSTSVYVLPGSEHPGRRSYVPFSITLKCLVYNDFPFKKMPHAKSAKSTPTTVLYGIFSSENSFPCTVICNAHQYEIACRREHLCQAYGCAKTYLEHDFPRYKTHSTIRNPGFCCPVITPISVKITSQNLNILEKGMDET